MMADERDFWEAIANAESDDYAPSWMYADWLEEQGDPRADFVRAQCEHESLPPWSRRRKQLAKECQELLSQHSDDWLADLEEIRYEEIQFRRGVPAEAHMTAENFLADSFAMQELAPTIRRVKLVDSLHYADELACANIWQRFTHVDLSGNLFGDNRLAPLFQQGGEGCVEQLNLSTNNLTSASVARLLYQRWARGAEWSLEHNRLDAETMEILADEAERTELPIRGLRLRGNSVGNRGLQTLSMARLPELRVLDLQNNGLTYTLGGLTMSSQSRLQSLETLNLGQNGLQSSGTRWVAMSPMLSTVDFLQLRNNGIRSDGLNEICESIDGGLTALVVGANRLDDDCVEAAMMVDGLRYLDITDNPISDRGVSTVLRLLDETEIESVDMFGYISSARADSMLHKLGDERVNA